MGVHSIKQIKEDIKGKRVLLRLGLNVPMKKGIILDDFRIRKSIATIDYLKKKGAKVIILSHIGRDPKDTLRFIVEHINKYTKVGFISGKIDVNTPEIINNMKNGTAIMLENLRQYKGEQKNSTSFAKLLASLGDIYVNDAFSVSHREHASIVGIPKYLPSYAGFLLEDEIYNLGLAKNPRTPSLFILGGAKPETKISLAKKYIKIIDYIFVGGALANNFFKEEGFEVGKSVLEDPKTPISNLLKNKKLILPEDVVVKTANNKILTKLPNEVNKNDKIIDVGPKTLKTLKEIIKKSNFILFNGPLGEYELGFGESTKKILRTIARRKALSIVGGGDTSYLANQTSCLKKCTFISTGGGATLEFLAKGKLPGIEALEKKS